MNHLILTRLASGTPTEDWLRFRLKIFEDYCAPSLRIQTCKNFIWLLAIAPGTPKWFTDRVARVSSSARFIYTKSTSYELNWPNNIPPELITPVILTTRLDSDDALHKNFVKEVQHTANQQKYTCALDSPFGYSLDQNTLECYEYYNECNHFITVLEYGTFQTVYCTKHKSMGNKFPVIKFCQNTPLWVEGFHGSNVSNKLRRNKNPMNWNNLKNNFS